MTEFKPYLVSYRHGGKEWNVQIMAQSYADARERLGQLALGRIEGVIAASIPGAFGPFAALTAFLKNVISGYSAGRS